MEIPDEIVDAIIYLQFSADRTKIRHWSRNAPDKVKALEKYHHSRTVEALKRENEELQTKLDALKKLMQEPSEGMVAAGWTEFDKGWGAATVFEAMTSKMLKEVE